MNVPVLPVFATLSRGPAWRDDVAAGDGAHSGAGGYAALAAVIEAWPAWRSYLP